MSQLYHFKSTVDIFLLLYYKEDFTVVAYIKKNTEKIPIAEKDIFLANQWNKK